MNPRNYNGWILCPSKRFPGKFYFFNVLNGEAAWNLNDVEKNAMQSNFHKVTDNWHSYPEPDSPPVDDPALNWHYKKQEINCERPMQLGPIRGPTLGQTSFQKHQESFNQNVVWIPVQKPMIPTDCHYKTWNTHDNFLQNSAPSTGFVWYDNQTTKMQENVFNNKMYDVNSNSKWTNYNSPSFGQKNQKNIVESNSSNQIFGQKPELIRKVRFGRKPDQPVVIKRSIFNTKPLPDHHTEQMPESIETVENSGFGLWSLSPMKRPVFTRTRTESEPYQSSEPVFQSRPNENVIQETCTLSLDTIKRPVLRRNRRESEPYHSNEPVFQSKPNENVTFDNCTSSLSTMKRPVLRRTRKESKDYQDNQPVFQSKRNENETPDNFTSSLSTMKRPLFIRTCRESEVYQNNEPAFQSKPNENVTRNISTFGNWSLNARKRMQFGPANQVYPKENVCSEYEEPDSLDEYNLSPKMETGTRSNLELFGKGKFIPAKYVSNLTVPEGYFMPSLGPMKKVQFPKTPALLNKTLSKSIEDLTLEDSSHMTNSNTRITVKNAVNANKGKETVELQTERDLGNLETDDLRYLLLAKKRKFGASGVKPSAETGKRKATNNNVEKEAGPPKKRVTFDLGVEYDESLDDEQDEDIVDHKEETEAQNLTIETLKSLAEPAMDADVWYIAVDTEVLMEDFEFIDGYVQTDEQCSLLIPPIVKAEVEAMSVGSCAGRPHAVVARHLSRRLNEARHITVLPADEMSEMSTDDAIINCCMQIIDQNFHVVLVVKDTELYNKAKSLNLHCFKLQEVKDSVPKPEVSFVLKKIQNSLQISRITEKNNNIFPKTSRESNPFALSSKNDIPIDCFRKCLFGQSNSQSFLFQSNRKNVVKLKKKENQETPAKDYKINFPQKFTQPNQKAKEDNESDAVVMTSQINHGREHSNLSEAFFRHETLAENENLLFKKPNKQQIKNAETNQPQMQSVSNGIRKIKSINSYTVDEHLKLFYVINKCMEQEIRIRIEELLCCFTQIMEDVLTDVLQDISINQNTPSPWSLSEALECLADLCNNSTLNLIVEKLAALWYHDSKATHVKGVLKPTMLPADFMKIFGCGVLLIKWLKETILPKSTSLAEAEMSLTNLLENIENPVEADPLVMQAPVPNRCEHIDRKNFVKNSSEVLMYLKKHFREWKSYGGTSVDNSTENVPQQKKPIKIVRTFGKNLNKLKLDVDKSISLNTPRNVTDTLNQHLRKESDSTQTAEKLDTTALNNFPKMKEIDLEKRESVNKDIINMIDNIVKGEVHTFYYKPKPSEKKVRIVLTDHKETTTKDGDKIENANVFMEFHENGGPKVITAVEDSKKKENANLSLECHENDGPKVIRIAKEIKSFEDKLKGTDHFDLDVLDYDEMSENFGNMAPQTTLAVGKSKENIETTKVFLKKKKGQHLSGKNGNCNENVVDFSNDTTNSEFESQQAHYVLQSFLMNLKASFENVNNFINTSILEYREKNIPEEKRRLLHETADKTYTIITAIVDKLKSVLERESNEETALKKILETAGVQISTDNRFDKYSQIITLCLEEALLLEYALKIMLSLNDDCEAANMVKSIDKLHAVY